MSGGGASSGIAAGIVDVLHAGKDLATIVGPGWGLAFVFVVLFCFPHVGLGIGLARLLKEDRVDARKRKVESKRLAQKYLNRSRKEAKPVSAPESRLAPPTDRRD